MTKKSNALLIVFLLVVLSITGTASGTPSAFFAFGDSYADTGNQNHIFACWKYPYGITWPGRPTGRFGNGHIQTDYLADKLGLPSPTPAVDIDDDNIATGVNFALGGSGVTYALGTLPLFSQLNDFELLLRKGVYSDSFLADSVTLVSNVGNDYSNPNYTNQELSVVVQEVLEGLTLALERLYDLGLRNVLVANLPPIGCIPQQSAASNYTTCREDVVPLIEIHNELLLQLIQQLNTLPNANFIILNELNAFTYILNNTSLYGITEKLEPCCKPKDASHSCGDVDLLLRPQYTLCDDPTTHVYWDADHPVESTWKAVVDLFYSSPGYVIGATTLQSWLYQISVKSPAPASAPAPGLAVTGGAVGQLYAAYEALIDDSDYAESIGLLQAVNFEEYLAGLPDQTVTVFLPYNVAWYTISSSTILTIYGTDQILPLTEFHVVHGYYDGAQLKHSAKTLTTISGLSLKTISLFGEVLVGPDKALVVKPDLYNVKGQVAVHGISQILLPPQLE